MGELNRENIIIALECCSFCECDFRECPYYKNENCLETLHKDAFALLNELIEENDRLNLSLSATIKNLTVYLEECHREDDIVIFIVKVVKSIKENYEEFIKYKEADMIKEDEGCYCCDCVKEIQDHLTEKGGGDMPTFKGFGVSFEESKRQKSYRVKHLFEADEIEN